MKQKRQSPEQIVAKLREVDAMLGTEQTIGQVTPMMAPCSRASQATCPVGFASRFKCRDRAIESPGMQAGEAGQVGTMVL